MTAHDVTPISREIDALAAQVSQYALQGKFGDALDLAEDVHAHLLIGAITLLNGCKLLEDLRADLLKGMEEPF